MRNVVKKVMECSVLRCLGKNILAVQLRTTGAVISLLLPSHTDSSVLLRLKEASAFRPIPAVVALGEYRMDKYYFICSEINLGTMHPLPPCTTKFRRVAI